MVQTANSVLTEFELDDSEGFKVYVRSGRQRIVKYQSLRTLGQDKTSSGREAEDTARGNTIALGNVVWSG